MTQPSALAQAESLLLTPFSLTEGDLSRTFGQILKNQVDYADLYFQYSRSEAWSLDEGIVKSGSFNIDQGVGVRAISGEKTAFAYSDDISARALGDVCARAHGHQFRHQHRWQRRFIVRGRHWILQAIARPADGEALVVQQVADASDHQHLVVLVIPAVASPFHGPQLGELLLPIAQDMRLDATQLRNFTNREVPFGGYGRKLGAHGW